MNSGIEGSNFGVEPSPFLSKRYHSCILMFCLMKSFVFAQWSSGTAQIHLGLDTSLVVGAASLCSSEVTLFLFLVLSTSSPYTGAFRSPVRVRGEDLGHFSSVSMNVTLSLIHKRVIKAGWGIFLEKLFSG